MEGANNDEKNSAVIRLEGNIKVVDIPIREKDGSMYKEYVGCVTYTILIFTWVLSIFIPVALSYWLYVGNWALFTMLLTIILVPIAFKINDDVPICVKNVCNLLTKDIHYWTGPARVLIEEPDFEENSRQLLCIHPHGILGIGSMYLIISRVVGNCFYLIVTESLVWFQPIISVILNSVVKLRGASRISFRRTMENSEGPLLMFPGGFHETILLNWGVDRIYANRRFGFIKYCLKYNYSIRPVYVFGECLSFHQLQHFKRFRWFLNDFSLPSVLFCGETWWNPLLPVKNVPYLVVIGKPIRASSDDHFGKSGGTPLSDESNRQQSQNNFDDEHYRRNHHRNPSKELVRKYQSLYIESLQRIYKQYSPHYAQHYKDNEHMHRYLKHRVDELIVD